MFVCVVLPGYLINHIFDLSSCEVAAEITVLPMTDLVFEVVNDVPKGSCCGNVVFFCQKSYFDLVSARYCQPIIV